MKKFPLALFVALAACAAYVFLSWILGAEFGVHLRIISRLIFVGMLCTLLTTSAFTAGESYSRKQALILALGIGFSIPLFSKLFFVVKYYEEIEPDRMATLFLGFLISPKWWMWNIWVFVLAYFVLRKGFNRRITQDNFFNN